MIMVRKPAKELTPVVGLTDSEKLGICIMAGVPVVSRTKLEGGSTIFTVETEYPCSIVLMDDGYAVTMAPHLASKGGA